MSAQILTTSNICVETIESIEDEFNITSSNSIIFETDNILIGDVSFSEFCSNIVFGVPINEISSISSEDIFKVNAGSITSKDEITNMSEYELLSIDCTQITSDETYETGGTYETGNKEHYINIQGKSTIYISSENIFVKHQSYNEHFHDYTYRMINKKSISQSAGLDNHFISRSFKTVPPLSVSEKNTRIADVINMGTYVTKKILCNAVTTENIYNSQENTEAQLKLKSNSAIRLNLNDIDENKNNIFIEDDVGGVRTNISLNQYINYRLDEYGLINIDLEAEPGVDITIYFNQNGLGKGFSNYYNYIPQFQRDKYKVNFKIVLNKPETNSPSIANIPIPIYDSYQEPIIGDPTDLVNDGIIYDTTKMIDGIFQDDTNDTRYPMSNLTAGNFYNIYADVTNNFTGITYYNILTSAVNVPTIEHVVIDRIAIINEREIEIEFSPHVTVVPTWYNDPNKLVYFSVKLYGHGDSSKLSNGTDFTYIDIDGSSQDIQLTYDIGKEESRQDRSNTQLKYRFNVNTFSNYDNPLSEEFENYNGSNGSNVIMLNGSSSDATRNTVEHIFSIVSNHTTGNFEMISIPEFTMPTESFDNPNAPSNFSVQYPEGTNYPQSRDNIFEWTRSDNSDSRITKLFYEIFKDTDSTQRLNTNHMEDDLINYYNLASPNFTSNLNEAGVIDYDRILQYIGEISTNDTRNQVEGIIPGTYKIRAYNFFGQRSDFAEYTVTELNVTNVMLTPIEDADKEWTILYQIENNNGNYLINPSIYDNTGIIYSLANDEQNEDVSEISFNTSLFLSFDMLYRVNTLIQDTAMKIKSYDTTLTITQPTIDISSGLYANLGDRIFAFTIQIVTTSLNSQSIEFLDGTPSPYQNISYEISNSEKIKEINNVTINTNGNTNLDTLYTSTYLTDVKLAQIRLKVNDLYLDDDSDTVSYTPTISFSLTCKDKYGYETAITNISTNNNEIPVNFASISVTTEYTGTARQFGLNSTLIGNNTFTGYQWLFNNNIITRSDGSTYTNNTITITDGANLFGDYRCKITQKNHEGFQKKIYSSVFNNPAPTILDTGKNFEITTPIEYEFEYTGDEYVALNSLGNKNFAKNVKYANGSNQLIRISRDGIVGLEFKVTGTYTLEVFVRNEYYFGKYFTIGTYHVTTPDPASITAGPKTYKSITINYTLNANGRPNQNPTSVKLYMDIITPIRITPETEKLTITTNGSSEQTGLHHDTIYYFKIIKNYGADSYDSVQNTPLSIQTYNKPTPPSITGYTRSLTSITVRFNLGSNSDDPANNQGPKSFNIRIDGGPTVGNLTSSSGTFTNLRPGSPFDFTLYKEYKNPDFGTYTVTGSSSTSDVVQASLPTITLSSKTHTTITLSLGSGSTNGSAGNDVSYQLLRGSTVESDGNITYLDPDTPYHFTYKKIIGSTWTSQPYNMESPKIATLTVRTDPLTPPTDPTISPSSTSTSTTILINYDLNGKGQYTGNMTASLYYSTSSSMSVSNLGSDYISLDDSGNINVTQLMENTPYFFIIEKIVQSGYGYASTTYSNKLEKATIIGADPPVIRSLSHNNTDADMFGKAFLTISWSKERGGADYYNIRLNGVLIFSNPNSAFSTQYANSNMSELRYLLSGDVTNSYPGRSWAYHEFQGPLLPNTTYPISVLKYINGIAYESDPWTFTTYTVDSPTISSWTPPTVTDTSIEISFGPGNGWYGEGRLEAIITPPHGSYTFYRDHLPSPLTITGLSPSTDYTIVIRKIMDYDTTINYDSVPLNVRTLDPPPPISSQLRINIVKLDGTYVSPLARSISKEIINIFRNTTSHYDFNPKPATNSYFHVRKYPITTDESEYIIFTEGDSTSAFKFHKLITMTGSYLTFFGTMSGSGPWQTLRYDWSQETNPYYYPDHHIYKNWLSEDTDDWLYYNYSTSGYSQVAKFRVKNVTSVSFQPSRTYNKVHILEVAKLREGGTHGYTWYNMRMMDQSTDRTNSIGTYASIEFTNEESDFGFVFLNEDNEEISL